MKIYKGVRTPREEIVTVDGAPLDPRFDVRNHSPTGFNWGYNGSGPTQLALALCCDAFEDNFTAVLWYMDFRRERIATLSGDTWSMTQDEILDWIIHKLENDPEVRRSVAVLKKHWETAK